MYSFEQLTTSIWNTDIIYDESFTMVRNNGVAEAKFLFTPIEILSVTSADKTQVYEEGKDWEVCEDILRVPEHSRIFAFEEDEVIFENEKPGACFPTFDGKYSLFHEDHFFHDRQICVTYRKADEKASFQPEFCGALLPRTMEKLRNKETLKIVLHGDSISAGANSSGMTLTTPFLPTWGALVAEKLKRHYQTGISFINSGVGGTDSYWGIATVKEKVIDYAPDLVIIAFGMNDGDEPDKFAENIKKIKDLIKQELPDTEFILCATTIPNKCLRDFYKHQVEYRDALMELEEEGTAIADFNGMQKFLMEKKRFIDTTGNNVNHPNDFMIRCHAQVISDMLIE